MPPKMTSYENACYEVIAKMICFHDFVNALSFLHELEKEGKVSDSFVTYMKRATRRSLDQ